MFYSFNKLNQYFKLHDYTDSYSFNISKLECYKVLLPLLDESQKM